MTGYETEGDYDDEGNRLTKRDIYEYHSRRTFVPFVPYSKEERAAYGRRMAAASAFNVKTGYVPATPPTTASTTTAQTYTPYKPLTVEDKKAWWASRTPAQKSEWLAKKNQGK